MLKQYTKYVTKYNTWNFWYSIGFRSYFIWAVNVGEVQVYEGRKICILSFYEKLCFKKKVHEIHVS